MVFLFGREEGLAEGQRAGLGGGPGSPLYGALGPVASLWAGERPRVLSSQQLAALAVFAAGLVAGLHGWQAGGIALDRVAGKAAVLIGAQVGGGRFPGAAVGVTVGALAAISSAGGPYLLGLLAQGGPLAGLGQRLGKPGTRLAFSSGFSSCPLRFPVKNCSLTP